MRRLRSIQPALLIGLLANVFSCPALYAQSSPDEAAPYRAVPFAPAGKGNGSKGPTPAIDRDPGKAAKAYREGLKAEKAGNWEPAYSEFAQAFNWAPDDANYFAHREVAKGHLVQIKMDLAEREAISGRLSDARQELLAARSLDPTNRVIAERFGQLSALEPGERTGPMRQISTDFEPAGEIHLEVLPGTQNFNLRGNTETAYEEIARRFGVEVAFDVDLRQIPVRFQMIDLDFYTAMRLLEEMTGTFWRPLTKHLFFVAQDTSQKRKEYGVSVVQTILLPASATPDQMTEMLRMVWELTGIARSDLDTRSRTLTLRASPQALAVASSLIEDLEKPVGELVLEIEVLEVDRTYARMLGILPPQTAQIYSLSKPEVELAATGLQGLITVLTQVFGQPSSLSELTTSQIATLLSSGNIGVGTLIPPLLAFGGGATTFLYTLPGATANFGDALSLVKHGRRIMLRAEDGKAASFFVGEKFPVTLAQFSSSLAGTGGNIPGLVGENFPTTTLNTGVAPFFLVTGDFNNDGNPDLAVANNTDNTVMVFLGNGDGTFGNEITTDLDTGAGPVWLATGNFNPLVNNDTFLDLAVVNKALNSVSILLGKGDGTFTKTTPDLTTGKSPVSAVAANFHDTVVGSTLDLAVANQADNSISIFQGNGDGTFKPPTLLQLPAGFQPTGIAAAALTGSGHTDLIVTDQGNNSVSVFLGNGDGTFQPRTDYATGAAPVYVATGDFNGDGILDLAVANFTDNTVSVLLGIPNATNTTVGSGTFQTQNTFPTAAGPTSLALADYNVDGILDIAVAASGDNAVSVLLGLGGGIFGPHFELPVGTDPVSIVTADFNNSGKPDVATANEGSNTISVILNNSNFTTGNGFAGTPFPGVEYIDIGVKVKATPRVHPNDEVTLKLNFEITSLTGQAFNGIPVVANETFDQTVRLKEDESTAIAGILQPQSTTLLNGTPGIATLPGIGFLGGTQNAQDEDTELMILVTPRLVELAPRVDHVVYAGRGALEGPGAFGPTRQEREGVPLQPLPQTPPQPAPPEQQPQQQQGPQDSPQPQPRPEPRR
jgi:Bacterial type II and III secretion system protein/FG-GAP-like repeat